jgi:hypothetical protein
MEPIEIIARFGVDGRVTPLQISWKGRTVPVESTGRRWDAEDGKHILAMVPGDRVVELIFAPAESRWFLRFVGSGGTVA